MVCIKSRVGLANSVNPDQTASSGAADQGLYCLVMPICLNTVNLEIFVRVLFLRNFAYAKFRENKIPTNWRDHSVVY